MFVDFNDRVLCQKIESFRNFKWLTEDKAACQRVDFNQHGAAPVCSPPAERLLCTVIADPVLASTCVLQPVHG
jgi:hypothetical protein